MLRPLAVVLGALPALAALAAAWPVLDGYFYADDFAHLFELAAFGPRDFLLAPYGGHMLLARNAVFYASWVLFGMEPRGYFILALATHVANAWLLAALVRRLTGHPLAGCLAGVLFAASPAATGVLAWYAVYGHALATAATLLALLAVAPGPGERDALALGRAVTAVVAMLVASQSFGSGAAAALVFPAVVLLLRPATYRRPAALGVLAALPVLVLGAWWIMNSLPTRLNPFGVRAATGLAVLAGDYRHVALMATHLLGIGIDGLVLGPAFARLPYGGAASALAIVAFGVGCGVAAWRASPQLRRALLAFLLASAACYLAVAAGRAALFSAYAHDRLLRAFADATRYQYLAQALLAVATGVAVAAIAAGYQRTAGVLLGAWIAATLVAAVLVRPSLEVYTSDRRRVAAARQRLATRIRSHPPGAPVCLPIDDGALAFGFPGSLGLYVLFHPADEFEGRRVWFVSADPQLLALRAVPGRLRDLLAPEGECPPDRVRAGAAR